MRLARTTTLAPGPVLARDVVVGSGAGPLLRAGVALTDRGLRALVGSGVGQVWIEDELSEGIVPRGLLSERLRARALAAVEELHAAARQALARRGRLAPDRVAGLKPLAELIADEVVEAAGRAHDLACTAPAPRYLPHHATDTAALAVLVARRHLIDVGWRRAGGALRHDAPRSALDPVGAGVLLCDHGMLALPRSVLEDARPLDEAGVAAVREHPVVSADLLDATTSFVVRGIVRGHHERWDGRGYPEGLAGAAISRDARVVAVADAYLAMVSDRVHAGALPAAEAWRRIVAGAGGLYDPEVVEAFRSVVAEHQIGHDVLLADGRTGVVSDVELGPTQRITVRVRDGARVVEEADAQPA